jgi:hypothetical protein
VSAATTLESPGPAPVPNPIRRGRPTTSGSELRIAVKGGFRRPIMALGSVAVIATFSALFAVIYIHSSKLVAVIGVARQVPQGQLVQADDLRQVDVSIANGIQVVPLSQASLVIGKPASVTLLSGTLLSPSDLGGLQNMQSGQAVVGVDLKPGMFPASGVVPGEAVIVVLTGPAGTPVSAAAGSTGSSGVISSASVVGVDNSPDGSSDGDVVVSVEVPSNVAPLIADASAAGQAALIQVGGVP